MYILIARIGKQKKSSQKGRKRCKMMVDLHCLKVFRYWTQLEFSMISHDLASHIYDMSKEYGEGASA